MKVAGSRCGQSLMRTIEAPLREQHPCQRNNGCCFRQIFRTVEFVGSIFWWSMKTTFVGDSRLGMGFSGYWLLP